MVKDLTTQRLIALFCCGWLMFDFPLLGLWDLEVAVFGVPLLPAALLSLWGLLIAVMAWLMECHTTPDKED